MKDESDSCPLLEGADETWFTICTHDVCDEGPILSDLYDLLSSWTGILWRRVHLPLELSML